MHLTIKERVELVLMSGADGVCYYYLNCFICFGALFMAQNVCYYYLNCFICFGALFMAQNVCYYYLNCFICFGALFMAHPVYRKRLSKFNEMRRINPFYEIKRRTSQVDLKNIVKNKHLVKYGQKTFI